MKESPVGSASGKPTRTRAVIFGSGDELIWDRHFGRPRNAIVLPEGWYLTTSEFPAIVSETEDGRIRLDFWDDEPDGVDAFVKALRRTR